MIGYDGLVVVVGTKQSYSEHKTFLDYYFWAVEIAVVLSNMTLLIIVMTF